MAKKKFATETIGIHMYAQHFSGKNNSFYYPNQIKSKLFGKFMLKIFLWGIK